mgnify:CR=1 FL=1
MIHFLKKGERRPKDSVYVDYPSIWSKPRGWDVGQYTLWILQNPVMLRELPTLKGKTLCLYKRDDALVTYAHILAALAALPIKKTKK